MRLKYNRTSRRVGVDPLGMSFDIAKGTLFSSGTLLGDTPLNGADQSGYFSSVDTSFVPVDNSTYTDAGQDPSGGSGSPNFLTGLDTALSDAFKAYAIAQTPPNQRNAVIKQSLTPAPAQAAKAAQTKTLTYLAVGLVIVIGLYFLIKAAK